MTPPAYQSQTIGPWRFLPERMVLHVPTGTLVVADLHLGYSRERANRGDAVPIPSLREELAPLLTVWLREKPESILIAGDLVEKPRLDLIQAIGDWRQNNSVSIRGLVTGNHDGKGKKWPFPVFPEGFHLGETLVIHAPDSKPINNRPILHGHEHPAVPLPGLGLIPCFLVGESRLILPAYSRDASGGNVFRRKDWLEVESMTCLAIAGQAVENLGTLTGLKNCLIPARNTRAEK